MGTLLVVVAQSVTASLYSLPFRSRLIALCLLPIFTLEQFFLGHCEHLAHGIVEPLVFRFAGNIWSGQWFHFVAFLAGVFLTGFFAVGSIGDFVVNPPNV